MTHGEYYQVRTAKCDDGARRQVFWFRAFEFGVGEVASFEDRFRHVRHGQVSATQADDY